MQELSRRNEHFTDSVIRRMTRISIDCGAINLAQGFPDFDPPKAMTDRLEEVSRLGPHQYPITMGAPNFRQALSRKCERFMGMKCDPETEMVVTIGSTEAMVDTIFALTNPGDKIVMFSPYFENYRAQTIMAGCEPVFVPLVPPAFGFDPEVLEDAFRQHPKAILICNPSNPSGKVFTEEELKTIADLYGLRVDDLLTDGGVAAAYAAATESGGEKQHDAYLMSKVLIAAMWVTMVWVVAVVVFLYSQFSIGKMYWMAFVWAVPVSFAVAFLFSRHWEGETTLQCVFSSLFVWSTITAFYFQYLQYNIWAVFFVGVPVQIALILGTKLHRAGVHWLRR